MRSILTCLKFLVPGILFAQVYSLPKEPTIQAPMLFDSIESFPAHVHKVRTVKSYSNNQALYVAEFDVQGRIIKLVNKTQPTKPITTVWTYSANGRVNKKLLAATRWEDTWYNDNGNSVHVQLRLADSIFVIRRPDGQLLDSARYRSRKLEYRETRTYTEAGVIQHMVRTRGNASDLELSSEETYQYDTKGNLIHYSAIKAGQPLATENYTYNSAGLKTSDLIFDPNGNRLYSEVIDYNKDNQPVLRKITGFQGDTTNTMTESWEYDNAGRMILHKYPTTFLYAVTMNYEYRRYLNETEDDFVKIRWSGNNLRMEKEEVNGNIRTVSKYKYAIRLSTMPEPRVELESDTLFLIESMEEYDILQKEKVRTKSYTYDSKNRIDIISEHTYSHDGEGRLIRHDSKHIQQKSKRQLKESGSMVYSYNADGKIANLFVLDSAGKQISYSNRKYDNYGHLILFDSCRSTCIRDSFAYDSDGRITYSFHSRKNPQTRGDTTISIYNYSCGKLSEVEITQAKGYLQKTICTYNLNCLPTEYHVSRENNQVLEAYRFEYAYY